MTIEIRLLGEFSICIDGSPVSLTANRFQALVTFLALHAPQSVRRAEIAFLLWADSSDTQAHTNLRKTLHQLKQSIPELDLIHSDKHTLRLNLTQHDRLDVADFTSALNTAEHAHRANDLEAEQNALETAVSLYHGDLLSYNYDDWLIPERERLRSLFIQAADRLVALLEASKYYRDAIKIAQRLLLVDSLREETYRALIRLHALNNDRAAALNVYHTCAGILAKELGIEPDASTRELYELLLKRNPNLPQAANPVAHRSSPLIAREQEWKTALAAWKEAVDEGVRMFVLSGETGIGKTRLADELYQWATRQGIRTSFTACYPVEAQSSYVPLIAWLRSMPLEKLDQRWKCELARLIPEIESEDLPPAPMTESWQKQVFFEALAHALSPQREPLLLWMDDLHWCDADTLEWLHYFMHFDKNASILVLATLRTEDISSNPELQTLLLDLRAANQITEVELPRLSKEQTGALGAQLLEINLPESETALLFEESEGVPLFVVELARADLKVGLVQSVEANHGKPGSLPPRLQAILEGRLARLSMPARAVAESAAILGREFDLSLLRKISELDETTTIAALDELWRRRMVRERGGDTYDFSHDKLREATLAGLSPVRSRWLNQRAGEALEKNASDDVYGRIADHFERAGMVAKSAEYYARAASRARNIFALQDALEHLTRAIRLETNPSTLATLHEQHGDVLQLLERREDAISSFSQALGLATGHLQRARLERKQVTLSSRHDPEFAMRSYQMVLAELEQARSDPGYWLEWIETQFTWIEACYWQQNAENLYVLLQQTREPVEHYGTLSHKIHYQHCLVSSAFVRERYRLGPEYIAITRENIGLAIESKDPYQISTAVRFLGMAALCANQLEISEPAFCEAIKLCEKNNDYNSLLIARVYLSFVHRRMCRVGDVGVDTQLLKDTLQKVSKHPQYEGVIEANQAWLAYLDGKIGQARHYAKSALEIWMPLFNPYPLQWIALFVLFAISIVEEQVDETLTYAQALLNPPQQRLIPEVESALLATLKVNLLTRQDSLALFKEALAKAKAAGYI